MKLSKRPFHHSISIYDLVYRSLLIRGGSRGEFLSGSNRVKRRVHKCKRGETPNARITRLNGGGGIGKGG